MTTAVPPGGDHSAGGRFGSDDDALLPGRHKRGRSVDAGNPGMADRRRSPVLLASTDEAQLGGIALLKDLGRAASSGPATEAHRTSGAVPSGGRDAEPDVSDRRGWPHLGLVGVLALQSLISLSLTWSNSAFGDEANYLWVGHLELAHWFGGAPTAHFDVLSGAPLIYPPLGALASAFGGLTGARVLSLVLMLGATVLLYSVASRLFGRRAALASSALWAVSVSSLKLGAFATFDPLAVFFMCLSAWLIVQAAFRRRAAELAILAALAMLLADLTAYSYAIYDLPIVAFAISVWWLRLGSRRTVTLTVWFLGSAAALGFVVPTLMGLWAGIVAVTVTRTGGGISAAEHQGYLLPAQLAWEWSGLVAVLGLAGACTAVAGRADKRVVALLSVLSASAFLVPVYQLHLQTGWALDKHLACGIWLAAMPAGYVVARVARIPSAARGTLALAATAALAFPTVTGWMSAYSDYQTWPNATQLIATVKPLVAAPHTGGLFTGSTDNWIFDYYTGADVHGPQWGEGPQIHLNPTNLPYTGWPSYFQDQLKAKKYSLVALQFPVDTTQFSVAAGSASLPSRTQLLADLKSLTLALPSNVGIDDFASAVESSASYQLVRVVPYSDDLAPGSYLIWKRIGS
jgi:Dolichyl-phosphate-mannose-protein mannosyltransferase